MTYYVAILLPINSSEIDKFRKKFDPKVNVIAPHITLVFPLPNTITEKKLLAHVQKAISDAKPFNVCMEGIAKTHDHYLYLTIKEGSIEIESLHDQLYSGLLEPFLRKDLPYIPHCTVGYVGMNDGTLDEIKYEVAKIEAEKFSFRCDFMCNTVTILGIENTNTQRVLVKTFHLKD